MREVSLRSGVCTTSTPVAVLVYSSAHRERVAPSIHRHEMRAPLRAPKVHLRGTSARSLPTECFDTAS